MISLISSLKNLSAHTLLLEVTDTKSIQYYKDLGIDDTVLDHALKNLKKKKNEKSMSFYGDFFGAERLDMCFPKKESILDDRCDALRNAPKNTLFLPAGDFIAAYEALTLSTYSYDRFITKKEEKNYSMFVPETEKKNIEKTKPLLDAIVRARDIINLPPTDTRPEAFVEYIKNFKWKNFKLRIIDAKELQKLGCNLLLAV